MAKNILSRTLASVVVLFSGVKFELPQTPGPSLMRQTSPHAGGECCSADSPRRGMFGGRKTTPKLYRKMMRYGYHYHGHLVSRSLRQSIARITA